MTSNRGRSPASQANLNKPLKHGQTSVVVRVRGRSDVMKWFSRMTAEEKGAVVEQAFEAGILPSVTQEDSDVAAETEEDW